MSDSRLLTKLRLGNIRISVLISGGPLALELLDHIDAQAELIAALRDEVSRLTADVARQSHSRAPLPASRGGRIGDDR